MSSIVSQGANQASGVRCHVRQGVGHVQGPTEGLHRSPHKGFSVEFIGRDDYPRLAEFDALLIRETTAVNHHTWRFARRAQAEDLAVIDDPDSILRCANKVYLAEVLKGARIPTPRTLIVPESGG